jgi:hypothetical protein
MKHAAKLFLPSLRGKVAAAKRRPEEGAVQEKTPRPNPSPGLLRKPPSPARGEGERSMKW